MSVDVIDVLKRQAELPGRVWMHRPDGPPITYAELLAETGRFAGALVSLGVGTGDRVLVQLEKCPEVLTIYLACLRIGAVFLPVNSGYTAAETAYFLSDAEPALAIVEPSRRAGLAVRAVTLEELAAVPVAGFAEGAKAPGDLAAILYTSGTTGRSKGVMLSRGNLSSNAEALVEAWAFGEADVLLHALPVFHTHGLFVATNTVLYSGASMIFQRSFRPADVLEALPLATVMMGVPTFYSRLLAEGRLEVGGRVRLFVSGSAPLSPATFAAWEVRTGHRILERYGMTETNMITSNPYHGERKAGTVGRPLPGVSVRIADPVTGAVLPEGEIGSIEVAGPNVFSGYWRRPDLTATEFRSDGHFITGDLGAFDSEGYLAVSGRAKDLVISGGLNVYPAEVEAALDRLSGVSASAVIGVPHPDFGEAVVACVVGEGLDEGAMRAALREGLAAFKVPKRIVVLDDLPRNAMGKVQKAELRGRYAGLFSG